jgi:hypothetical protein
MRNVPVIGIGIAAFFVMTPIPPKTYYPGTPDRSAAIPIVVGSATQHDGVDFVVDDVKPLAAGRQP